MYILGIVLLIIGATTAYFDKKAYNLIFKRQPEGNDSLKVKGIGFVAALSGAILIVIYFK